MLKKHQKNRQNSCLTKMRKRVDLLILSRKKTLIRFIRAFFIVSFSYRPITRFCPAAPARDRNMPSGGFCRSRISDGFNADGVGIP